jgi:RimJ/RimL family protein N-acetyltransferase
MGLSARTSKGVLVILPEITARRSRPFGDAQFDMEPIVVSHVRLRDIEQDDLPRMYEFNLDPDANRLAGTIPRSADAFRAHWENVLADPNVIVKAISVADVLAGHISCFKLDGFDAVGYWVSKDFWGKGIASRALELLLEEVPVRPLHARVATSNRASLRVLQKCGFVVQSVQVSPADDRFLECEEAFLILK